MSADSRDDDLLRGLGARARARADGSRALEDALRAAPPRTELRDRVVAAVVTAAPAPPVRRLHRAVLVAAPLAAAAALLFALAVPGAGESLPVYDVAVSGHVATLRAPQAEGAAVLEDRAGTEQEVILRPRQAVRGPLGARVLVVRAGVASPLEAAVEIGERGVVRLRVAGEAVAGASEVQVVLGPPGGLGQGSSAPKGTITVIVPVVSNSR